MTEAVEQWLCEQKQAEAVHCKSPFKGILGSTVDRL